MGHTQTGVYEEEAEATVDELLRLYDVPPDVAEEAKRRCELGQPIKALDILVRNR